ncbi:SCP2 sterol-binding domain-containing protein [Pseudonocardia endophytica]|uniref:SCP-2 sterol transfer family protein n=1 Tax=Pseudonocardia endophytica TaxID=401976 RepID=A0A4R1HVJ0_PSEEN|nr:SCP2 sterol-binding domain-containing protein [Pseudonocardia endophytica]TCK26288.1 SCP-2 sterol transfer family protein [Pseudonocardia endophytica]
MALTFLSDEWCAAAMEAINANDAVHQGFKAPETFDHPMYLGLLEKDVTTYFTFKGAKLTEWSTSPLHDAVDFGLRAKVEHYREAAEGKAEAGTLLMGGQLKLVEGDVQLAIQNAAAFNAFLRTFGEIDTDWDV